MAADRPVIQLCNVGKMYKLFQSRADNMLDALGFSRFMPWRKASFSEFWALRGVNLKLHSGERVGIVGRNGSGKTTMLKLITRNFQPTEGNVTVSGKVQALMDAGAGFHPEFTGYENIRASLIYHGLKPAQIEERIEEIAEFTELGNFLGQPFKTYSAGMQARLTFATATAINPEILIVDEILGTGDGYFIHKSSERVQKLIMNGATVIVVSHSTDQIVKLCEKAIWVDRGHILQQGSALEVTKAYEQFLRKLNDRRVRSSNLRQRPEQQDNPFPVPFTDCAQLIFVLYGESGNSVDLSEVVLLENDQLSEHLFIGDAQDARGDHACFVQTGPPHSWSESQNEEGRLYRTITARKGFETVGGIIFYTLGFDNDIRYAVDITYRTRHLGAEPGRLRLWTKLGFRGEQSLPATNSEWKTIRIPLTELGFSLAPEPAPAPTQIGTGSTPPPAEAAPPPPAPVESPATTSLPSPAEGSVTAPPLVEAEGAATAALPAETECPAPTEEGPLPEEATTQPKLVVRHWPGKDGLTLSDVRFLSARNRDCGVFAVGEPLTMVVTVTARTAGRHRVIPACVVFRKDGVVITKLIGEAQELEAQAGDRWEARLAIASLNLGDGPYVVSVSIHWNLDPQDPNRSEWYDVLDRSYEFEVCGNPPLLSQIFQHDGTWSFRRLQQAAA